MISSLLLLASISSPEIKAKNEWQKVEISYYTSGKKTADGTPMSVDGFWVATRKFPLGTKVEIEYRGKSLVLKVKDKTAKHTAHRADLPLGTWKKFGQPKSKGILRGRWRKL